MFQGDKTRYFESREPFRLQNGISLPGIRLAYHTYGRPDLPVLWVFHALTGSSRVEDWWASALGPGLPLDPARWHIICVNMPGSCYGSFGPTQTLPGEQQPRYHGFPELSIRDQVRAFDLLRGELGIGTIDLAIGSSMGGQQLLEWASWKPELFNRLALIATNAQHSAWGRAFNAVQRMAIEADPTFSDLSPASGKEGMAVARAAAMLSYRSYADLELKSAHFSVGQDEASYLRHAGQKLQERFHAASYHLLTRAMDSHACGRADGLSTVQALQRIRAQTLIVSVDSDLLFPPAEQAFLATHIPGSQHVSINSPHGHDAFLIEFRQLNHYLNNFIL